MHSCYPFRNAYCSFSIQENHKQIRRSLYLPRIEDKNSNMRMLKISSVKDLVANSMDILEPAVLDFGGNQREEGMLLKHMLALLYPRHWAEPTVGFHASKVQEIFITYQYLADFSFVKFELKSTCVIKRTCLNVSFLISLIPCD